MEMLEHAVAAYGDGAVVNHGLPEEVGSLAPCLVLLDVGNALESNNFRNLRVGMNTRELVLIL